ncbi:MAG: AAA family ATPase [Sarcina sp.]
MGKKIADFASELGLTNNQIIEIFMDNNIIVNGITDEISRDVERKIKALFDDKKDEDVYKNASKLNYIQINGLFNNYKYKFKFDNKINLFIAENGSGKTTILNIIVSVLNNDIEKLIKMPFSNIEVGIEGKKFVIDKKDLENRRLKNDIDEMLMDFKKYMSPREYRIIRNTVLNSNYDDYDDLRQHLIYSIERTREYSEGYTDIFYKKLLYRMDEFNYRVNSKDFKKIKNDIKEISKLLNEEIVYMPTFRRVEEELDSILNIPLKNNNELKYKINNSSINFGIRDVEKTLNDLTNKLKEDATDLYARMNAEVLNDLLSNKVKLTYSEKSIIDKEKIDIVVGRIGKEKIREVDKLLEFINNKNNINVENRDFLEYYIFKLINIYEIQKGIDDKIKRFINVCNKYLVNKNLEYNEVSPKVTIVNKYTKEEVLFINLSSGEKQILSLFSKVYLNLTRKCIFVIDEPELSLSILWQKNLINDLIKSKMIGLLIGATHSPFIFDDNLIEYANELESYKVGE